MLESKQPLESNVFQAICKSRNTRALLEYILKKGEIDASDLSQGATVAFAFGQSVNMNLLLSKLDKNQMTPLFYSVVHHVMENGCSGTLGEILKNPFFMEFILNYKSGMETVIEQIVSIALEAQESKEFVRAIDVLLRVPELAKDASAQSLLYRSVSKANIGLGTIIRRRCPAILQNLDIQPFVAAMEVDGASEVFDAFADIFVMSAEDLEACFHAAMKKHDRDIIGKMYQWAKTNDYMVGLEARMGMADRALRLTEFPNAINCASQMEKRQKIEAEVAANRVKLRSFGLVLSQEFDLEKVRCAYEIEEAIRKGQAEIAEMTMARPTAITTASLRRRLWTLVCTEDVPVQTLKEIARDHHFNELNKYLEKYKTN
jgi:hypothetical protein